MWFELTTFGLADIRFNRFGHLNHFLVLYWNYVWSKNWLFPRGYCYLCIKQTNKQQTIAIYHCLENLGIINPIKLPHQWLFFNHVFIKKLHPYLDTHSFFSEGAHTKQTNKISQIKAPIQSNSCINDSVSVASSSKSYIPIRTLAHSSLIVSKTNKQTNYH